jgi:hypothetical protein
MSTHGGDEDRRFSKLAWLSAVRCCKAITADRRLVIEHLGNTADQYGRNAWRGAATICGEIGVSQDTVKRARADAVKHGLLLVTKPAPRGAGNTKTAEYRLLMPVVTDSANHSDGADDPINRGTGAPICDDEIGARLHGNRGTGAPEIGALVHPPSGSSSGNTSGERGAPADADEPLDVEAVPDHGNALSPMNFSEDQNNTAVPDLIPDGPILDAEITDDQPHLEDDDTPPDRFCPRHMPRGSHGEPCGGCRDARENRKEWNARRRNRDVADLLAHTAAREHQDAAKPKPKRYRCNDCRDTEIVLNGDGRPGSTPRLCHHDRSWHPMTPAEIEAHADTIAELEEQTA